MLTFQITHPSLFSKTDQGMDQKLKAKEQLSGFFFYYYSFTKNIRKTEAERNKMMAQ